MNFVDLHDISLSKVILWYFTFQVTNPDQGFVIPRQLSIPGVVEALVLNLQLPLPITAAATDGACRHSNHANTWTAWDLR